MTAQLDLDAPARVVDVGGLRRRARVHLESPSPVVLPRAVGQVTEAANRLGLGGFVRTDAHGVTGSRPRSKERPSTSRRS